MMDVSTLSIFFHLDVSSEALALDFYFCSVEDVLTRVLR
jgi:hypothetical protein